MVWVTETVNDAELNTTYCSITAAAELKKILP